MRVSLAVLLVLGLAGAAPAVETIVVHGDQTLGPVPDEVVGFLHGIDEDSPPLPDSLISLLRPRNWRLYKIQTYQYVRTLDVKITYGISNHYAWSQGGFPQARPWLDWAAYEQYITNEIQSLRTMFPGDMPEFFDVWAEPDHPYFWTGTYEQLLELFYRCHNVVKAVYPPAKLVGPSVSKYIAGSEGVADIVGFAADLEDQYGIRLDALSWHENESGNYGGNRPEHIIDHVDRIRSDLAILFPPDYQPELHVNESVGNQVHLSPGYSVGYIYYLGRAGVDAATRACWNVYTGNQSHPTYWSDCWDGLNGMITPDTQEPQPAYWVYHSYAGMMDGELAEVDLPNPTTPVLASRHDSSEVLRLIMGRYYHSGSDRVAVRIEGYPYDHESVAIHVSRIPHYPDFFELPYPRAIALPDGPVDGYVLSRNVTDGIVEFGLGVCEDNDAYVIEIAEDVETGLGGSDLLPVPSLRFSSNRPNPFNPSTTFSLSMTARGDARLCIYDGRGAHVATLIDGVLPAGDHSISWDGRNDGGERIPSGIYFARLQAGEALVTRKMTLLR